MSIEETRAELANSLASVFEDHPKQSGTVSKGIYYHLDRRRYRVTHRGTHLGYFVTLFGAERAKNRAVRIDEIAKLEKQISKLQETKRKLEAQNDA